MHGTLPEKYWSRLFLGERWPVKCSKELGDIACELKTSVNWILLFLRVEKISVSVVNSWDLWMDFNSYSPGRERNTFRIIETGIWGTRCMKCLVHGLLEKLWSWTLIPATRLPSSRLRRATKDNTKHGTPCCEHKADRRCSSSHIFAPQSQVFCNNL